MSIRFGPHSIAASIGLLLAVPVQALLGYDSTAVQRYRFWLEAPRSFLVVASSVDLHQA